MPLEVLAVDAVHPEAFAIGRAAAVLRAGGLVAFPTETVYGLGANALDESAVARIFAAKGRPAHNPVIVHVPDLKTARPLAADWPEAALRLAERFWPGSLTLVLPRSALVPDIVTAGGPTVALRVPAHPVALALLREAGLPVAAPSANLSGQLSPTRAEHVLRGLGGRIELLLDGGPAPGGLESTVLDLTVTPPRLLRPGLVELAAIAAVAGLVVSANADSPSGAGPLPSPGMLSRHYAPRAPLEGVAEGRCRVEELCRQGLRVGWLTFTPAEGPTPQGALRVGLPQDPAVWAAHLYAVLHDLDQAGVERIVVDMPPSADAWLAVRDRLRRASNP